MSDPLNLWAKTLGSGITIPPLAGEKDANKILCVCVCVFKYKGWFWVLFYLKKLKQRLVLSSRCRLEMQC